MIEIIAARHFIGDSSESKPILCNPGSTFFERDTKRSFIKVETGWAPEVDSSSSLVIEAGVATSGSGSRINDPTKDFESNQFNNRIIKLIINDITYYRSIVGSAGFDILFAPLSSDNSVQVTAGTPYWILNIGSDTIYGMSSSTKPTNIAIGTKYYEIDSKLAFIFANGAWYNV